MTRPTDDPYSTWDDYPPEKPFASGEYDSRDEDEPAEDIPQELTDAADELLEALSAFAQAMGRARGRESELATVRRFASYHLADLEGKGHGWLGNTLLYDDLRELYELGLEASARRVDEEGR